MAYPRFLLLLPFVYSAHRHRNRVVPLVREESTSIASFARLTTSVDIPAIDTYVHAPFYCACACAYCSSILYSIHKSFCKSIHKSILYSIHKSFCKSIHKSFCKSIHKSILYSIHKPFCKSILYSIHKPFCKSIHKSILYSIHKSFCKSIHKSFCKSIHKSILYSIHKPFCKSILYSIYKSFSKSILAINKTIFGINDSVYLLIKIIILFLSHFAFHSRWLAPYSVCISFAVRPDHSFFLALIKNIYIHVRKTYKQGRIIIIKGVTNDSNNKI